MKPAGNTHALLEPVPESIMKWRFQVYAQGIHCFPEEEEYFNLVLEQEVFWSSIEVTNASLLNAKTLKDVPVDSGLFPCDKGIVFFSETIAWKRCLHLDVFSWRLEGNNVMMYFSSSEHHASVGNIHYGGQLLPIIEGKYELPAARFSWFKPAIELLKLGSMLEAVEMPDGVKILRFKEK